MKKKSFKKSSKAPKIKAISESETLEESFDPGDFDFTEGVE